MPSGRFVTHFSFPFAAFGRAFDAVAVAGAVAVAVAVAVAGAVAVAVADSVAPPAPAFGSFAPPCSGDFDQAIDITATNEAASLRRTIAERVPDTIDAVSSYDAVPYTSVAYPRTHPDHLHAMARVFGVRAPDVERCRVLEIGCGSGGNLLAIAASLPHATCVGVDASTGEIARARAIATAASLSNVELVARDVADYEGAELDYVIAHGVLSWVPSSTRDAIFRLVRRVLAPNGVAYLSYNVHPGWHFRGALRAMLRYHAAPHDDPLEKIRSSRALLDWLSRRVSRDERVLRPLLDEELERLAAADDAYLFHEHLEDDNHAFWFHEIASEAARHGLRFLAEADPAATVRARAAPRAYEALATVAGDDVIRLEQHFDFVRARAFRASLFVREENERREAEGAELVDLAAASSGASDLLIEDPIVTRALDALAAHWPDAVRIDALDDPSTFAERLAPLHAASIVELRARPLGLARSDARRPRATSLARHQARGQGPVTNLRHEPIPLAPQERAVLAQLDGTTEGHDPIAIATLARLAFLRD